MPTATIRFTDAESELIRDYAKSQRRTVSDAIRLAILDKIEDEYDTQMYLEAKAEHEGNPQTVSHDEMMRRYGYR